MIALLRRHVLENPVAARLMATAMTGPKLGGAFLLVCLALLVTYVSLFAYFLDAGHLGESRAGELLYFWQNVVLYALLCILLPLKVAGTIEGTRLGRSFDQLVVTGASPLVLFLGSWCVGILYTVALLVPSIPFVAGAALFGGVDVTRLAGGYAILIAYANVIIAVTLALSVFQFEWVTVPATALGFLAAGVFAIIPEADWVWGYPGHIAEATPLRLFYRQSQPFELWGWSGANATIFMWQGPFFFGWQAPIEVYPWALWGAVLLGALALLAVGPAHRFVPGLNAFGAVTFAGDRKRRFLRFLRGGLARRIEVAFLYENRARWLSGWSFLTRALIASLATVFLWGLVLGRTYMGSPSMRRGSFYNDEWMCVSFVLNCIVLCVWILAHCDPRYRVLWRERIWRWEVPRELALGVNFLLLAGCLLAAQYWTLSEPIAIALSSDDSSVASAASAYAAAWWAFVPGLLVLCFNLFLLSRVASRATQSANLGRAGAIFAGGLLVGVPTILLALTSEKIIPDAFLVPGALSPVILVDEIQWTWEHGDRIAAYFMTQGGLLVLLTGLLVLSHLRGRRRAGSDRARTSVSAATAALVLAAALAAPSAASAQAGVPDSDLDESHRSPPIPGLVVEQATRGFDGFIFSQVVDFVTVTLRNDTEEAISGDLWFDFDYWSSRPQPFEIGSRTTRVLRLAVPLDRRWAHQTPVAIVFEAGGRRTRSDSVVVERVGPQTQRFRSNVNPQQGAAETYLVVAGESISQKWIGKADDGSSRRLVACAPRSLPERPGDYDGVPAVFVRAGDLASWTPAQRQALQDWVRLGGSAVFFGGLAGLPEGEGWKETLEVTASRSLDVGEAFLRIEELVEGRAVLELDLPGGSPIPLLVVRRIGAGSVGHLSFDISDPRLPRGAERSPAFWNDFASVLPESVFPFVAAAQHGDHHLWDVSSMVVIGGYLLLYSLAYGLLLVIFFRKRRRQAWLWLAAPAIPCLCLLGLPVLDGALHGRPSRAEVRELTYFGPGSSRGARIASLRIRSSGRQRHTVTLRGEDVRAFQDEVPDWGYSWQWRNWGRLFGPEVELGPAPAPAALVADLPTSPWAGREIHFLDTTTARPPVEGEVTVEKGNISYRIRAGLDPDRVGLTLILLNVDGTNYSLARLATAPGGTRDDIPTLAVDRDERGEIAGTTALGGFRGVPPESQIRLTPFGPAHNFLWDPGTRPRAVLAFSPEGVEADDGGFAIASDELLFEREVSADEYRRWTRYNYQLPYALIERDGRFFQHNRHRVVLVELDIVVR